MKEHQPFLDRCLALAERGRGRVSPNPLVGAVLVRRGSVIAESFHEEFGALHAERRLLEEFKGEIAPDDILYVNLEPCCHAGKTPPCTAIIIERGVKRVVFGMRDAVHGGQKILRSAGLDVIGPADSVRCRRQNRGFVSLQERGRPWITLKRAQKSDGSVTGKITTAKQDAWSHEWLRGTHDAILVGVETVIRDDPQLTVRHGVTLSSSRGNTDPSVMVRRAHHDSEFQPQRIILDPSLRIPPEAKVVQSGTTIVTAQSDVSGDLSKRGVHVASVPLSGGSFDWPRLWEALPGVTSILVEGGPETWRRFKEAGMMDEEVILTQ